MLDKYSLLLNKIPKDLIPLMKPHKDKVDTAIKPGLISVTWTSTNIRECKSNKRPIKIQNIYYYFFLFKRYD
jgi:hypothetical protein